MSSKKEFQSFADDEVRFWVEQESSIHLKAATPQGDPVELSANDARKIAAALIAAAQQLDPLQS